MEYEDHEDNLLDDVPTDTIQVLTWLIVLRHNDVAATNGMLHKLDSNAIEDAIVDTLVKTADEIINTNLSVEEMEKIHDDCIKRLKQVCEKGTAKPLIGSNRSVSHSSTPLRGVSTKKMKTKAVMTPTKTPKKSAAKGGKLKEHI